MTAPRKAEPRYRRPVIVAAYLLCLGLTVQAASLGWAHPTAFVLFLAAGSVLVAAGVITFLWAFFVRSPLVAPRRPGSG